MGREEAAGQEQKELVAVVAICYFIKDYETQCDEGHDDDEGDVVR